MKKECLVKALHIYEAHELIHAASRAVVDKHRVDAERYVELAKDEIRQASLSEGISEELWAVLDSAEKWIPAVEEKVEGRRTMEAVIPLGNFLDKTKDLMFEVVVDCECGKQGNPHPKQLTVPEQAQLRVAKGTLKMPDALTGVMGGMTKQEAKEVIKKLEG